MIGRTLGHYEITAELGQGGMGEVYQATDTKLGRPVAIKTLHGEFATDTERLARFEREAQLLASLNHPNIGAIYGLEEHDGKRFLVLELVEGKTLDELLEAGPLPVEFALVVASQIAEALEAAHGNGVIHRDLKPANIKITPDRTVKVLDFGLAKAFATDQAREHLSTSPTVGLLADTELGIILGTAAYMSPEQARGKDVDTRSDIWALGCVLFEMLAGHRVFDGGTFADALAKVIATEPNWDNLPPDLHPRIRLLLERCLDKDANDRYHNVADARVDIRKALAEPVQGSNSAAGVRSRQSLFGSALPWILTAIAISVSVGLVVWNRLSTPSTETLSRYVAAVANDLDSTSAIALSPDSRRLVYAASGQLHLRAMDQSEPVPIPGTELARDPFFSPDGKWLAFFTPTHLKKVQVSGGTPVVLADVSFGLGGTWDPEGRIYFGRQGPSDLFQIPDTGGPSETFANLDDREDVDYPEALPGGKWVLYSAAASEWYDPQIMAQSLETGERKVVLEDGYFPRYAHSGHLLYASSNRLIAVPFDADRAEVTGSPVVVVEALATSDLGWPTLYAIARNGSLVFAPGVGNRTLVWMSRDGTEEDPLAAPPRRYSDPRLSPDGGRIAMTVADSENWDVWAWDLSIDALNRLTFDDATDADPLWSPDGQRFAFFSDRDGGRDVFWKAADGTGAVEQLVSVPGRRLIPWSWSRDGKTLLLSELFRITGQDIGVLSMEGDRPWATVLEQDFVEAAPEISPDGRWMAYLSNESGQMELYVRPFPDVEAGRWQVSPNGADDPVWTRNGRELIYRAGNAIMSAGVEPGASFSARRPELLFETEGLYFSEQGRQFDVTPDGNRFIMIKEGRPTEGGTRGQINIVLNWVNELKERVPAP
jgi:serine/threonine protein kinase